MKRDKAARIAVLLAAAALFLPGGCASGQKLHEYRIRPIRAF